MIGKSLGNYRIVDQVGLGGMATVYKAFDAGMDRYVALKVLPEYHAKDPTFKQRFQREAKAIAHLEHMNILPVYSYGEEDDTAYLVMRYMPTGTLADRIAQGPIDLAECSRLLEQIAGALDYAHQNDILHRDVKPSNILIDANGNAFLTDFGIARMLEGISDLTGSGIIGTPQYMSPEQCQGRRDLLPASDQYSLGVVLYEMVTGRKPFHAETPMAVIMMHLNDLLPPPKRVRSELPEAAEVVILKAMAKQPEDRFPSCSALAAAFTRAVERAGFMESAETMQIVPPDASTPTQGRPPAAETVAPRRIRAWILAAGVLGVLVLIAVGAMLIPSVLASARSGPQPIAASTSQPIQPPVSVQATVSQATASQPTATQPVPPSTQRITPGGPTPIGASAYNLSLDPSVIDPFAAPIFAAIKDRPPDFADDFSTASEGWNIESATSDGSPDPSLVSGGIHDGMLTLETKSGAFGVRVSHPGMSFNNMVLDTDIVVTKGASTNSPNGPTVIWRWDAVPATSFTFTTSWSLTGWQLTKRAHNDPSQDREIARRNVKFGSAIHIQVIALGARNAIYLNGAPAAYFEDSDYLTGQAVLFFPFADGPVTFSIDQVRVWNLDNVPGLSATP